MMNLNMTKGIEDHKKPQADAILFGLAVISALGAFIRYALKQLRLPYTVILMICGIGFGLLAQVIQPVKFYGGLMANVDPETIAHVFLPILIFESSFSMDYHTFMRCFAQCLTLALPGIIIAAALTAVFAIYSFSYNWDWPTGFLFGFVLSATDPVAVVALLRELGTSKVLTTIIEGESLLNDGSAIVGFRVCYEVLRVGAASLTVEYVVIEVIKKTIGAPLFGIVAGSLTVFCLARVFKDSVIEITITLCAAYLTYTVAEDFLDVSGVLALVALGLTISAHKESINPEVEEFVLRFWEMLTYLSNTIIFVAVGLVITLRTDIQRIISHDGYVIAGTYTGVTAIRFIMIVILSPILTRMGYGMQWQHAAVMAWAGLRGAIPLSLALLTAGKTSHLDKEDGETILLIVAGTVALTLLINATTMKVLLLILGMNKISQDKRSHMTNAIKHLHACQEKSISFQKKIYCLANVDWDYVQDHTYIEDPFVRHDVKQAKYEVIADETESCKDPISSCIGTVTVQQLKEMEDNCRRGIITAQKMIFLRHFQHGILAKKNVRYLLSLADAIADRESEYMRVDHHRHKWQIHPVWRWVEKRLEKHVLKHSQMPIPMALWRQKIQSVVNHIIYDTSYIFIVITNIVVIIKVFSSPRKYSSMDKYRPVIILNGLFALAYVFDTLLKITGNTWKRFWKIDINKLEMLINIIVVIDSIAELCYLAAQDSSVDLYTYQMVVQGLRMYRILKLVRLFHIFQIRLLHMVNKYIHRQLFAGYDIACAYYAAETEMVYVLDEIVEYPSIAKAARLARERNCIEIKKELARFNELNPGIAVAVTTWHATRSVLNEVRCEINHLKATGIIEDNIHQCLLEICEERIKRLYHSPRILPPRSPANILKNIDWMLDDEEVYLFIEERMSLVAFGKGENICEYNEPTKGIYVITIGTVKVTGHITQDLQGRLPNTNSFHWFSATNYLEDYLTIGGIMGELGFLTGKPNATKASCESEVEALYIKKEYLEEAVREFPENHSLKTRMWRSVAANIARRIFAQSGYYQEWDLRRIVRHIDSAYMPPLENSTWFNITGEMENIALIQGVCIDSDFGHKYVAPCQIPRNAGSLTFQNESDVIPMLFIISSSTSEYLKLKKKSTFDLKLKRRSSLTRVLCTFSMQRPSNYSQRTEYDF